MPIEIREVLIRAVVDPQAGAQGGGGASSPAASGGGGGDDPVSETVKKVFEMLRDKEER
jgi:hypothetical protein